MVRVVSIQDYNDMYEIRVVREEYYYVYTDSEEAALAVFAANQWQGETTKITVVSVNGEPRNIIAEMDKITDQYGNLLDETAEWVSNFKKREKPLCFTQV